MRKYVLTAALSAALMLAGSADSVSASTPRVVVYVASQGLCYGSVVAPNSLPNEGPFQQLEPSTICGPGTSRRRRLRRRAMGDRRRQALLLPSRRSRLRALTSA